MNTLTNDDRKRPSLRADLVMIWVFFIISLFAAIFGAGYVFDSNLTAYAFCAERQNVPCSGVGWYGSMALSLAIGLGRWRVDCSSVCVGTELVVVVRYSSLASVVVVVLVTLIGLLFPQGCICPNTERSGSGGLREVRDVFSRAFAILNVPTILPLLLVPADLVQIYE